MSPVQVQGAQFANDYLNHPDYRLVAAFFLGWVFFSGLRHACFSAFLRELMWTCIAMSDPRRARAEEPATRMDASHEKNARTYQSPSRTADMYHREQRDTLILLQCMAFMLASLSSFLSLLGFYPGGSTTACAFVVAATTIASQAARVFGLVVLGLDLKRCIARRWESRVFWVVLGLGTVLSGVTVGTGTGQLVSPQAVTLPSVSLCFRKRFFPTSLASSILNIILELYIIIRSLSLMQPPRLKLSIVQDAKIVQAGSLLLFDLLVVVPYATFTSLTAEFVTYSMGALSVLAAFNCSFIQTDSIPTRSNGPNSNSRRPSRSAGAPESSNIEGHLADRVIRVDNFQPSAIGDENWDIEAQGPPSQGLRAMRMPFVPPLDGFHEQAIPISSPRPIDVSVRNTVLGNTIPSVAPLDPGNHTRILSYSSSVWETFGLPRGDESGSASAGPQIPIEIAGPPTSSTGHSSVQEYRVASPTSTILGSDIIRDTHPNIGKDRMRVRRSAAAHRLSQASSIPSSSKRVTHHSWASILSTYPPTAEDPLPPRPLLPLPQETVQPLRWRSSPSLKSKPGSKSSRSSKSRKSSSSMRSAKAAVTMPAEGNPSGSARMDSMELSMDSTRLGEGSSVNTRRERASLVRGPRPPTFSSRIRREGVVITDIYPDYLRRSSPPLV